MHSVHYAAVTRKNDGIPKVTIENQACVFDDVAAGHLGALTRPVRFVKLTNRLQRNALANQSTGEFDQAVDIPRTQTVGRVSKVVLRAHNCPSVYRAAIAQALIKAGAMRSSGSV